MRHNTVRLIVTLVLGILVAPLAAGAQQQAKVPRIGWLSSGPPLSDTQRQRAPGLSLFLQGLRELGWIEGHNITVGRYAEENYARLPVLAAELVQLGVDVIVAGDSHAIRPAWHATNTIPIVMTVSGDPVRIGFVASLARPGGNITGLTNVSPEAAGKRLDLLKKAVPGIARLAVLGDPVQGDWPDEFEQAFEAATRERADALLVLPSPLTNRYWRRIVTLAAKSRLPAMYPLKEYVEGGGLMAYGPSIPDLYRRAATYVDKILRGTKPADLPVQPPWKYELVINLKTAKALGIEAPPMLLASADEVIE